MMINGKSFDECKSRAIELIQYVGLSDRINHKPSELSGGELQRIAIARALANNPKIIFADEPTGNLDTKNSQSIIELIKNLNKEFNQTFVLSLTIPNWLRLQIEFKRLKMVFLFQVKNR